MLVVWDVESEKTRASEYGRPLSGFPTMAINQVSLFFYPPRWQQSLTPDAAALTNEGEPVQIAHSVPSVPSEGDIPAVRGEEVKEW